MAYYKKWDLKLNNYDQNVQNWDNNKRKVFNVVLIKYPLYMGVKLQAMNKCMGVKQEQDFIKLLIMIFIIFHKHNDTKQ